MVDRFQSILRIPGVIAQNVDSQIKTRSRLAGALNAAACGTFISALIIYPILRPDATLPEVFFSYVAVVSSAFLGFLSNNIQ